MKRALLILIFVGALVAVLLAFMPEWDKPTDWRESYEGSSIQALGSSLVRERMKDLFPKATITTTHKRLSVELAERANEGSDDKKRVYVIVNGLFAPTNEDMHYLRDFVEQGNTVFIASTHWSLMPVGDLGTEDNVNTLPLYRFFNSASAEHDGVPKYHFVKADWAEDTYSPNFPEESMIRFTHAPFMFPEKYSAGLKENTLAVDDDEYPILVRENWEDGNIFVCATPQMFTNYHLLKAGNAAFIERTFSYLPADVDEVIWDEFYKGLLYNSDMDNRGEPNFLQFVNKHEQLRWAMWLFLALLGLYVASEVRRKQRVIPVLASKPNTTLDFTETIGRLYYHQRDHKNIAEKKIKVFLEAVRSRYQLSTTELDGDFQRALAAKSGAEMDLIASICRIVAHVRRTQTIEEDTLIDLSGKIDAFYAETRKTKGVSVVSS